MDFGEIGELIQKKPWVAVLAIALTFLVLRAGNKGGGGGGYGVDAMLKSQEIASRTNVEMARIGVERDHVYSASNALYSEHMRDLSLGAMQHSIATGERRAGIIAAGMQSGNIAQEIASNLKLGLTQASLGFQESVNGMLLQKHAIDVGRYINDRQLDTSLAQSKDQVEAMKWLSGKQLDTERELGSISMMYADRADARYTSEALPLILKNNIDAIWHQGRAARNIAKVGADASIWNNIIGTAGGLASKAMTGGMI